MKQPLARTLVILSLVLNSLSFVLTLIALYLPQWKSIELSSTFTPRLTHAEQLPIDPLIRGEMEKYIDRLYRRGRRESERFFSMGMGSCIGLGERHSLGLFSHCLVTGLCGQNLLPTFDPSHYSVCHSLHSHHQCRFSPSVDVLDPRCTCERPSYVSIVYPLLVAHLICLLIFLLGNLLRLYRLIWFDDIQLRLLSLVSALLSSICLITLLIQHVLHRFAEPLEFFEAMRRHYSRIQIYSFSNDLNLILQQIQPALDVRLGPSFICMVVVLVFTSIGLVASSVVEIKLISTPDDVEEEENDEDYYQTPHPLPIPKIRLLRQTKV